MKIIDLTLEISNDMKVYEGDPQVKITRIHDYDSHTWRLNNIEMGSHTGTHVDAFSHMHKNQETLDDIPLNNFFGESQVIKRKQEFPKRIGLFFIEKIDFNESHRLIEANPSFVGGNLTEELERELLKNKILTYTNLVNLEKIPKNRRFMFFGLPLKLREGDGSPVRAIAIINEK